MEGSRVRYTPIGSGSKLTCSISEGATKAKERLIADGRVQGQLHSNNLVSALPEDLAARKPAYTKSISLCSAQNHDLKGTKHEILVAEFLRNPCLYGLMI